MDRLYLRTKNQIEYFKFRSVNQVPEPLTELQRHWILIVQSFMPFLNLQVTLLSLLQNVSRCTTIVFRSVRFLHCQVFLRIPTRDLPCSHPSNEINLPSHPDSLLVFDRMDTNPPRVEGSEQMRFICGSLTVCRCHLCKSAVKRHEYW
jgi:hypothetical protein